MQEKPESFHQKLPRVIRNILCMAVAVFAILLITRSDHPAGGFDPFSVKSVNAEMIAAAPGFIVLSVAAGGGTFYIVDSTRQVICVYQLDGEKIRLVSARDFHRDTDIVDSSIAVTGADNRPIKIEGGSGVDVEKAAEYADGLKKVLEELENKKERR